MPAEPWKQSGHPQYAVHVAKPDTLDQYCAMRLGRVELLAVEAALTAAAGYVGSRVAGAGGAVVGGLAGLGVSALGETGRRLLDNRDSRQKIRDRIFCPPYVVDSPAAARTPATMLIAERALVPFIGRDAQLGDLIRWCKESDGEPLRVLSGAGGVGKTRLAHELASRLDGWDCVWLRAGCEAEAVGAVRRYRSLIIVDYAETRPRGSLADLVWNLAWPPNRRGIRVLLIVRALGDWWHELAGKTESVWARTILERAQILRLGSLKQGAQSFRNYYAAAIQAFSNELGIAQSNPEVPEIQRDVPILVVHIAALVNVLDYSGIPGKQGNEFLSRLLGHEDRYWQRSAEACGLSQLSRTARHQCVAELCLSGADHEAAAVDLLSRVPELADSPIATRRAVARWLHSLYPGDEDHLIGTLQPHLLAEHLVVGELSADREFLHNSITKASQKIAHHAFTVLGYAAEHDNNVTPILREILQRDPDRMLLPAISAATETGRLVEAIAGTIRTTPLSARQLAKIAAAIPKESRVLSQAGTSARRKLIEAGHAELNKAKAKASPDDRTKNQHRSQQLLAEFAQTAQFFRDKVKEEPELFREDLLNCLRLQKAVLTDLGRTAEAAKVELEIARIRI